MSKATQDLKLWEIGVPDQDFLLNFPVAASTKLYGNTMAITNSSGQLTDTPDNTCKVWGIVDKQTDNSSGAACALVADVRSGVFAFAMCGGSDAFTEADVGATVYAVDNSSVGKQSSSRATAGVLACIAGIGQGVGLPNGFVGVIMRLGGAIHT